MKITRIQTSNFIGARAVDIELRKPVAMITGKNGAGKSSIRDAIALAFTADLCRVSLKKEAATLISEGGESCFVEITTGTDTYGVAITVAGKISDTMAGKETPAALPYVLDAQRFSHLNDNERRAFLFGLMGVKLDGPAIKERLTKRGCQEAKVDQIMPILRTGFDAASKEAANRARDAKAGWKTTTGGETWGKDKAAKWQPAPLPEGNESVEIELANARQRLETLSSNLNSANQALGGFAASSEKVRQAENKRANLQAIHGNLARATEKLNFDMADMAAWEQKVADCKAKAGVDQPNTKAPGEYLLRGLAMVTGEFLRLSADYPDVEWPSDLLNRAAIHHAEYVKLHGEPVSDDATPDQEAIAKLPEYENALKLMKRSVENSRAAVESARIAGEQLKALDDLRDMHEPGAEMAAKSKVDDLTHQRKAAQAEVERLVELSGKAARRADLIQRAAALHAEVLSWADIADALKPDGIPGELLTEALDPINEHLRLSAANAEWEPAQINADMSITYGPRDYALISESEKWRADAMIAEAVSYISGLKLLVLDRFDVLDMKGREDLLYWLDGMSEDGDIDTALIFGTLKSLPAQLLPSIEGFWMENGTAGQIKEAA